MSMDEQNTNALAILPELAETVGPVLMVQIAKAICAGRAKYSIFAKTHEEAFKLVKSEMLEWESQAMVAHGGDDQLPTAFLLRKRERAVEEGLDVISTMARYINREYTGGRQ